jgi:hypothetical protein
MFLSQPMHFRAEMDWLKGLDDTMSPQFDGTPRGSLSRSTGDKDTMQVLLVEDEVRLARWIVAAHGGEIVDRHRLVTNAAGCPAQSDTQSNPKT